MLFAGGWGCVAGAAATARSDTSEMKHQMTMLQRWLNQHVLDHMPMHVRQSALDAVVIEAQPLVVEAEDVQDRRVQVVDRRDLVDGLVAEVVSCAVAEGAFDACAGEPDGETLGVVIAAVRPLLERRHAPEL